jgi:hypothetical protein
MLREKSGSQVRKALVPGDDSEILEDGMSAWETRVAVEQSTAEVEGRPEKSDVDILVSAAY